MEAKVTPFSSKKTLNLRGKLCDLSYPKVMAILNVTPDSFYDGNRYNAKQSMNDRLNKVIREGADIIDIGGYSSRPGATDISVQEEIDRVLPAIELARSLAPEVPLSVDTFRAEVATVALDQGADMINDISGGNLDAEMFQLVAKRQIPYVLMHMRGNPQNMASKTEYKNIVTEVLQFFAQKIEQLRVLGVNDIVIDPGFGFAKTSEQSFRLLQTLNQLAELQLPILAGLSRKSMIYKTLETSPDEALIGTVAANTLALANGASVLRVHDVKAASQTIKLFKATYG